MAKLILMVGIPGSGKSTLAKRIIAKGYHCMNADSIRQELYGEEDAQGNPEDVFKIFFERMEQAMQEEKNIVVDNTNLNPKHREQILERARKFNYSDVQLWLLDVPLEVCLERSRNRERAVADDIVTNMYMGLNKSGRPKRSEGKVVIIRPNQDGSDYLFFPQN